jgi:hypothetical protein
MFAKVSAILLQIAIDVAWSNCTNTGAALVLRKVLSKREAVRSEYCRAKAL